MAKRGNRKETRPPGPFLNPEIIQAPADICSGSTIKAREGKLTTSEQVFPSQRVLQQAGPGQSGPSQSALRRSRRHDNRQRNREWQPFLDQDDIQMPRGVGARPRAPMMVDVTLARNSDQTTADEIATEQEISLPCVPPQKQDAPEEGPSKRKTRGGIQRQKRRWLSLDLFNDRETADLIPGSTVRIDETERASSQRGPSEQILTQRNPLQLMSTSDQSNSEQSRSDRSTPKESLVKAATSRSNTDESSVIQSSSCAKTTDIFILPPLLQVPVEISEQILRYLLVADGLRICHHTNQPLLLVNKGYRPPGPFPYSGVSPEILRVNRRFYFEGLAMLYSENVVYFQQTFSVGGTGVLGIETYLANMSPVGRSMIKRVGFSVDLFSINLTSQELNPPNEQLNIGSLREVEAAYQYLGDNLLNMEYLWVFLWDSCELAEDVVAAASFTQSRRNWKQRLLQTGLKWLFLSLFESGGRKIVTVQGEMLWYVIAELLRCVSDGGHALSTSYTIKSATVFEDEVRVTRGCLCPCWREADSLTAWMANAPLCERALLRNDQAGNGSLLDAATAPLTSLSRTTPTAARVMQLHNQLVRQRSLWATPQAWPFSSEPRP